MASPESGAPVDGSASLRIHVDYDRCAGHGLCESTMPAIFEVGDDGVTHLLTEDLTTDLRPGLAAAVVDCPTRALSLEG